MDKNELDLKLKRLFKRARKNGSVKNSEILKILGEAEISPKKLEKLFDKLSEEGIEVIDDLSGETADDFDYEPEERKSQIEEYMEHLEMQPELDEEEERELFFKIKNGDEAAKKLFAESKLGFAADIVRRCPGVEADDLDMIMEGNLGLLEAIREFDPDGEENFDEFAEGFIERAVMRAAAEKESEINIPAQTVENISSLREIYDTFELLNGEAPTSDEMARELKISVGSAEKLMKAAGLKE